MNAAGGVGGVAPPFYAGGGGGAPMTAGQQPSAGTGAGAPNGLPPMPMAMGGGMPPMPGLPGLAAMPPPPFLAGGAPGSGSVPPMPVPPSGLPSMPMPMPMAMAGPPMPAQSQQQQAPNSGGPAMDEFRQGFLELLEEQALTDIEMTVGPQREEIGAHRAILAAQSNHFRLLIANDPESLPLLYPLPQLHPPAVKLLLRFFYTGLVTTVDCSGDPLLAVECLRAADAFSQGAPQDRPRIEALKLHLEAQLTSALDSDLAGKAIARLNTTGMKDTLDRCMPLFMSHARRNGGSVLQGLLEGVDLDTFVAAVKGSEFPGGEIQKFRFIRAWAEGNNAGEQEKGVLDSLIDLEGIGLDDMEREVEPSGIVPVQRLMRQYTLMARRLRAQSAMNRSGSSQAGMSIPGSSSALPSTQGSQTNLVGANGTPQMGGPAPPRTGGPAFPPMAPPGSAQPQGPPAVAPVFPPPGGQPPAKIALPTGPPPGAQQGMPQLPPPGSTVPPGSIQKLDMPQMPPPQQQQQQLPQAQAQAQGQMGGYAAPAAAAAVIAAQQAQQQQQMRPPPQQQQQQPTPVPQMPPPQPQQPSAQQQQQAQVAAASVAAPQPQPQQQQPPPQQPQQQPPAQPAPTQQPPQQQQQQQPQPRTANDNMGPLPLPGFAGWETTPDIQLATDSITFQIEPVRSIRMPVPLTSGTWRWVVLMEKTFGTGAGSAMPFGKKKTESYYPDVGILIGGDFDPGVGLRQQKNCCAWDGRDMVSVNGMPVPYSRAKGGPFKDGDVIMVDVDLDHKTLAFRKNGVECGTAIRGFPPMVHLVLAGRGPAKVRWLALQQLA